MPTRRSAMIRVLINAFFFAFFLLTYSLTHLLPALAAESPSVFRGVIVANSELGVRVVSVDAGSQAALADLRPEDIVVRVNDADVHSIDEFAVLSSGLKGRAVKTAVVIFRGGKPLELTLHLFSFPVLRAWGLEFVPDYDMRFAEPRTGWAYWTTMGGAFERAGKPAEALNAYLNALHHLPTDTDSAVKVSELLMRVSRERLDRGALAEGVTSLRYALLVMQRLFDEPLSHGQLQALKSRLKETLRTLHVLSAKSPRPSVSLGIIPSTVRAGGLLADSCREAKLIESNPRSLWAHLKNSC